MNNSDLFPNLQTYRDAYVHWVAVKPYSKGASKGLKPLGGNRRYDRSLIRQDGDDIVCSLYNTDVIRYKPDNSVELRHGGYESVSTTEFIDLVLRYRFGSANNGRPIARVNGKMYLVDGSGFKHRFNPSGVEQTPIIIRPDNSVEGGIVEYKHSLMKPVMARLRKHYAEFVEYMTFYAQSVGNNLDLSGKRVAYLPVVMSEMRWNNADVMRQRVNFFVNLNGVVARGTSEAKLETFFELSQTIAYNAKDSKWMGYTRQDFVTPQGMREHFYELCKYEYSDSLFEEVAAERGVVVRDSNEKYLRFGSDSSLPWTD
jgi:hypothetical protein